MSEDLKKAAEQTFQHFAHHFGTLGNSAVGAADTYQTALEITFGVQEMYGQEGTSVVGSEQLLLDVTNSVREIIRADDMYHQTAIDANRAGEKVLDILDDMLRGNIG